MVFNIFYEKTENIIHSHCGNINSLKYNQEIIFTSMAYVAIKYENTVTV